MTIGWPLYRPVPAPAASQGGVSFLEPASTLSAYSPIVAVASAREMVAPSSKEILGGSLYIGCDQTRMPQVRRKKSMCPVLTFAVTATETTVYC